MGGYFLVVVVVMFKAMALLRWLSRVEA